MLHEASVRIYQHTLRNARECTNLGAGWHLKSHIKSYSTFFIYTDGTVSIKVSELLSLFFLTLRRWSEREIFEADACQEKGGDSRILARIHFANLCMPTFTKMSESATGLRQSVISCCSRCITFRAREELIFLLQEIFSNDRCLGALQDACPEKDFSVLCFTRRNRFRTVLYGFGLIYEQPLLYRSSLIAKYLTSL